MKVEYDILGESIMARNEPMVSVIIIFLNAEKFIQESIESIFAQTYENWELLLVDDGSSDHSIEIAKEYARRYPLKVRYLEHEEHQNKGMSASRNLGISNSYGKYIAFLDADDVYLSNKLERQMIFMEHHPDIGMVLNPVFYWYEDGRKVPQPMNLSQKIYEKGEMIHQRLEDTVNLTTICGVLIRKSLIVKLGGFEDSFRGLFEDQIVFFKICLAAPVYCDSEYVAMYRIHPMSSMRKSTNKEHFLARLQMYYWLTDHLKRIEDVKFMPESFFRTFELDLYLLMYLIDSREFETAMEVVLLSESKMPELLKHVNWNYYSALCLHNLGINIEEALRRYDIALEKGFEEFWVRYNRGSLHLQLGNLDQARVDLVRATELKPDHEGARDVLQQLDLQDRKYLDILISNNAELNISQELLLILLESQDRKGVIIYPPGIDWNIPLLQRPQHIAMAMSSNNWLYFYCSSNRYEKISGFQKMNRKLYLTNWYRDLVNRLQRFVILIPNAYRGFSISDIIKLKEKAVIIYDYLDDINPAIQGSISFDKEFEMVRNIHQYLLENSDIVLVTAESLYNEAKKLGGDKVHLLPNAVDYQHFHVKADHTKMPIEIQRIKEKGNRIIGYYGALATWFDYELLLYVACIRPDLEFVLIGMNYDGSLDKSGIIDIPYPNIHYLGVKDYSILPSYAIWFDVCILPFIPNEITHATSPIKLFEYMGLGKPIVSTKLNEVMKYKNVLVANNYDEFADKIDLALNLAHDTAYIETLDREARMNTWEIRANNLDKILCDVLLKKEWIK